MTQLSALGNIANFANIFNKISFMGDACNIVFRTSDWRFLTLGIVTYKIINIRVYSFIYRVG